MIARISITFLLIVTLRLEALSQEVLTESRKDGTHLSTRSVSEAGKLLYQYTVATDEKTQVVLRESHIFFMNGKRIFSILEKDKKQTERFSSGDRGSVYYTVDKDTKTESVWLMDHASEEARLLVRTDKRYFRFEPKLERQTPGPEQ